MQVFWKFGLKFSIFNTFLKFASYTINAIVLLNLMFGLRDVLQDKQDSYFNIIVNNFLLHFYSSNQENLNLKAQKVALTYTPENAVKGNKETSFTFWPYLLGKKVSNNLQSQGNWPKLYSKFELTSMKGRFCSEIWLEWILKRNAEPWLCEGQGILWSQPCFCGIMHKNWSLQCN